MTTAQHTLAMFQGGGYYNPFQNVANQMSAQERQVQEKIAGAKTQADAELEASELSDLAARNERTAARQNAAAFAPRQNPRAGGSRYTRRGMWTPGGSGLDKANAAARTAARRKAAYAGIDNSYRDELYAAQNPTYSVSVGAPIRLW